MNQTSTPFSSYQKLVIALLALTQFTVVLDFMIVSPLGDMLMKSLNISPQQFGLIVSAYAFSAGISGLLTAGFADRFDRKKLFIFFYGGFIIGTLCCGFAKTYPMLVGARIITGLFGGVIGSISMAIVTDLFPVQQRGRVMGFLQMGFGASQVLGIPISLYLANSFGWEAPFLLVVVISCIIMFGIFIRLEPITDHLALQHDKSALLHLWHTVSKSNYRLGFGTTALLSIGGFMMMPFGSAYAINNLHVKQQQLPLLFIVAGISTLIIMPIVGKMSDKIDRFRIVGAATLLMCILIAIYTQLPPIPLALVMLVNVFMMAGIMGRAVPAMAIITSVPDMADRGAFMSVNSSLQQIAGGIAAAFAGMIVVQKTKHSPLEHYDLVGYTAIVISLLCLYLLGKVSKMVKEKISPSPVMEGH